MNFTMKRPCVDCPFLREGGIRLSQKRVREIAGAMLAVQGATFQCHATVDYDDTEDGAPVQRRTPRDQHCAGALIFAERQGRGNQMMRIAERLGMYDAAALMSDHAVVESVFASTREMLAANRRIMGRA